MDLIRYIITLCLKDLLWTNTRLLGPFISYEDPAPMKKGTILTVKQYLQHFIFYVTHEWAYVATALPYVMLDRLVVDEHFLIGPFKSYKDSETVEQGSYLQHFIFL
jgi:hypothetical protein